MTIEMLDVVALLDDISEEKLNELTKDKIPAGGLKKNEKGAVVEILKDGVLLVEFVYAEGRSQGQTKAMIPLTADKVKLIWKYGKNKNDSR